MLIGHILDISVILPVVGHDFYNSIIRAILQRSHFTYIINMHYFTSVQYNYLVLP